MSAVLTSDLAGPAPQPRAASALRRRVATWLAQGAAIVGFVALWHALAATHARLGIVSFQNVPTPLAALEAGRDLLESGKLARHLGYSLWRVGAGFAAASLLGIALGLS